MAKTYLLRDRLKNIDMLELLLLPSIQVHYAGDDGVLLEHDGLFLLSAEDSPGEKFLPMLLGILPEDKPSLVVLHSVELNDILKREHGYQTIMDCRHCVYDLGTLIPFSLPEKTEIRRLDGSHVGFVHENYHTVDDIGYIRERIEEGMFGAFVRGQCAGFIGTHDELSIGLLYVLPAYRKLGLAYALEAVMVNHLLSIGRLPFCQVELQNAPSLALQKKLGFTLSDKVLYWLERG
ncbi:MAG TPA: GNAT family N-acetyltransferase [Feifaniaceae bacterium]|nr:GNAT family N-acetyltransferase [Feifaniaceae bacterium]